MHAVLTIGLVSVLLLSGCDRRTELPTAETSVPVSAAPTTQGVLSSYEAIRRRLANDGLEGVQQRARRLERQARGAARRSDAARRELEAIAVAAGTLANDGDEIESARRAFGELSRHVVALLISVPKLREGRQLCECPMAPGYEKWVQPSGKLQNPYMGKLMLECGERSDW